MLNVEKNNLTILVPDNFLGKQVEIIAFIIDESKPEGVILKKAKAFSAIQLDTKGFKFNRDEANER
ncbi:MAG: hypothetical protein IPL49_19520 [Saprospirales bacterium]|nr:hypothetical protein [Saprospirales bacterium]MBK8493009.1 hypothetical protein [Saprospirales bacterium]